MENKKEIKKQGDMMVGIPAGSKFIIIYEHGENLGINSGGFMNLDEMLGFNRRCVNSELVERMLAAGLQKEAQEQAQKARTPSPPPAPMKADPEDTG